VKTKLYYRIDEDLCTNCGSCRRFCPVDAIPYRNLQHQVDQEGCTGCTICYALCPVDAVVVTEGDTGARVALDPSAMERVRARAWAKEPFYQHKRRLAGLARRHGSSTPFAMRP
jgi:MinD superfamily P-loop ATPase